MRTVALVPMKLNNRRLPGKNVKLFSNGRPLCYYILTTLVGIEEIDEVYVYCSDSSVRKFLPDGVKFLKRPKELDTDTTSMNEVLKSFLHDVDSDIYVMTHATAPFIKAESMRKGLRAVQGGSFDSSFAVKKVQDFFWKDGKPLNYDLEHIPRTQDLPPVFEETSGFYIYRKDVLSKLGRRIGEKPFLVEVGGIEGIDIDEEEDFIIADAISSYLDL